MANPLPVSSPQRYFEAAPLPMPGFAVRKRRGGNASLRQCAD
jgi:hypothetical protein